MNASPLVSICIPTRDHAGVLGDAIRSARAQRYPALEILVLDNASTDDTRRVAAQAAGDDARVRYVRHAQDIGMAGNFSACVAQAKGEFVLVLCDDDMLENDAVAVLAKALAGEPHAVLAAGGRILVDAQLRPVGIRRFRSRREHMEGLELMRECFAYGNRIGEPSAVMFRRASAMRGFSGDYSQLVDLEMWFYLLATGSAVLLPELVCRVRRHADQMTEKNIRSARLIEDKQRFFRQVAQLSSLPLTSLQKLAWDARMASSIARVRLANTSIDLPTTAVFHPAIFRLILVPVAFAIRSLWPG